MAEIRIEIQKEIRGIVPLFSFFIIYNGEKNMESTIIYLALMALLLLIALLFVIAIPIAAIISKIKFEKGIEKLLKEVEEDKKE